MKLKIEDCQRLHGQPPLHFVTDLDAKVLDIVFGPTSFLACAEYIQEHSPADLTAKAIDALNAESGPVHMGGPVLRSVGLVDKPVDPKCRALVGKMFNELDVENAAKGPTGTIAEYLAEHNAGNRRMGFNPLLGAPYGVAAMTGEHLDRAGELQNCKRFPGETDEDYRPRVAVAMREAYRKTYGHSQVDMYREAFNIQPVFEERPWNRLKPYGGKLHEHMIQSRTMILIDDPLCGKEDPTPEEMSEFVGRVLQEAYPDIPVKYFMGQGAPGTHDDAVDFAKYIQELRERADKATRERFNMACYKEAQRYGTVVSTVDWGCPDDRFGLPAGAHRLRSIDYNGKRYTFKLHNGDVVRIWEEVLPNG